MTEILQTCYASTYHAKLFLVTKASNKATDRKTCVVIYGVERWLFTFRLFVEFGKKLSPVHAAHI